MATGSLRGSSEPPAEIPEISGFKVKRWLGGGGMGDVFEVYREDLEKTFALKMIRPDKTNQQIIDRFEQEARALVGLNHPNITRFYDLGKANGLPYIVMEYVKGDTLASRLDRLKTDPVAAIELMEKIVDAVSHAHDHNVLHRDLKPSNILIDHDGKPYLADFGLARIGERITSDVASTPAASTLVDGLRTSQASTKLDQWSGEQRQAPERVFGLTKTGGLMGTYSYMSPEQTLGEHDRISKRSDVWSLGIILYELLTGHRPFVSDSPEEQLRRIREEELPLPRKVRADVNPVLERIVLKCLRKRPEDRYESATQLRDDLRRWLRARQPRRRWLLAAAIGACAILAVGLAVIPRDARSPQQQLPSKEELQTQARSELAAGKTISLISPEGVLRMPLEVITGKENTKIEKTAEGWTIQTTGTALVEFMDDPGLDAFNFVVEMRANPLAGIPEASVYAGRKQLADPQGDWHFLIEHRYRESPDNYVAAQAKPGGLPDLDGKKGVGGDLLIRPHEAKPNPKENGERSIYYRLSRFADTGDLPRKVGSFPVPADRPEVGGPWRTLGIQASGQKISCTWDRRDVHNVGLDVYRNWRRDFVSKVFHGRGDRPPEDWTPAGGIGLIVKGGSVSVRFAQIGPLAAR